MSSIASSLPPLFLSHGSPMTALDGGAAGRFMRELGPGLVRRHGRPRAILGISAHTLTREPIVLAAARHEAIYDFGGFDPALRRLRYDAPGAPELADTVAGLLRGAGLAVRVEAAGGLDHGLWTPLRHAFPAADIPVLPLSWNPGASPRELWALGAALAPLAQQGVLILASGSITHNLHLFMQHQPPLEAPEFPASLAFRNWWAERAQAADWQALFDYRQQAPHAAAMHPTDEHLLPWFIAAGAGGAAHGARRVHDSAQHGMIGMDAYAFGPLADSWIGPGASSDRPPQPLPTPA